jgi:hypothetical protein
VIEPQSGRVTQVSKEAEWLQGSMSEWNPEDVR